MTATTWLVSAMEVMWRSALTIVPPAVLVAAICRWGGCRPATRHLLWLVVLLLPVFMPFLVGLRSTESDSQPPSLQTETAPVEAQPTIVDADVNDADELRAELAYSDPGAEPSTIDSPSAGEAPPPPRADRELTDVRAGSTGPLVLARGSGPAEHPSRLPHQSEPPPAIVPTFAAGDDSPAFAEAQSAGPASDCDRGAMSRLTSVRLLLIGSVRTIGDVAARGMHRLQRVMPAAPVRVWLAGCCILLVLHMSGVLRFWRIRRQSRPAGPDVSALVGEAATALGLRRAPSTWISDARLSPMVGGLFSPRLVLPAVLWKQLDASGRRAILIHELAHLARRDHWVRAVDAVVTAVFWWHPAAWWARRRVREEAEICCDSWVTWLLPHQRRAYATALLRTQTFVGIRPTLAPTSGIGVVSVRATRLARRLTMVMSDSGRPRASLFGLTLALVPVFVAWLAVPVLSCPPQETPHPGFSSGETPAAVASPADLPAFGPTPTAMGGSYQDYMQTRTPQPLPQLVSNLYSQLVGSTMTAMHQPRPRTSDDRDDLEARLERLERQLESLSRQMESLGALRGLRPAVVQRQRTPAPSAAVSGAGGPIVARVYRLSGGKLEPLTKLMIREDVPIRVRPIDDGIEVYATPSQHEALSGFIAIIDPSGVGVAVAPRARAGVRAEAPRNWAIAPGQAVSDAKLQAQAAKAAAKALDAQRKSLERQAEKLREQSERLRERADELKRDQRSDSGARSEELIAKADAVSRDAQAREKQLAEVERKLDALSDASDSLEDSASDESEDDHGEDVVADLRAKAESNEKDGSAWFQLGFALHSAGRYEEAREAFERSAKLDFNRDKALYNIGCGYARQGDSEQAIAWLKKAWDAGFNDASHYKDDDDLKSLRDDPRFQSLIDKEHTAP